MSCHFFSFDSKQIFALYSDKGEGGGGQAPSHTGSYRISAEEAEMKPPRLEIDFEPINPILHTYVQGFLATLACNAALGTYSSTHTSCKSIVLLTLKTFHKG